MPFINIKLLKEQVSAEQKKAIIEGMTSLAVDVMGRDRDFTTIVIDDVSPENWAIGGADFNSADAPAGKVYFGRMEISKGTSSPDEMARMVQFVEKLMQDVLGPCESANYFIIDELNPDGWGYQGVTMSERRKLSK